MRFLRLSSSLPQSLTAGAIALSAAAARAESPPAAARTLVDVEGRRGVLESRPISLNGDDDDDLWRVECRLPCRRSLDPSLEYQISGRSAVDSDHFLLPMNERRVRVDADVGSTAWRVTGIVLIPVAGSALALGAGSAFLGMMTGQPDAARAGLVLGGGGLLALGAGIALVAANQTTVTVGPTKEPSMPVTKGLSLTPRGFVF